MCSVEGCEKAFRSRTSLWCEMHYERQRRHGDPSVVRSRRGVENKSTKKASVRPAIRDLEWAAGFLEGEGSFYNNGNSTMTSAVQVNEAPVQRLLELFGGSLRSYPLRQGANTAWRWAASGARARGVAMTLYSLMSTKRQGQIRNALV